MLRFFLLVSLLTLSLYALSDAQVLQRADKIMKYGTKNEKFHAYNDYRNIYLRSIINSDKTLKQRALEGIVKSGEELHIDVSDYRYDLQRMRESKQKKKVKILKKHISSSSSALHSTVTLQEAKWIKNRLILVFNGKVSRKNINYFTMQSKNKHYKYIFDIKPATKHRSFNLKKRDLSRVIVAQYKSNVLRLVIDDTKKHSLKYKIEKNKLIVSLNKAKKELIKKQQKKQTTHKKQRSKPSKKIKKESYDPLSKYMGTAKGLGKAKVVVIDAGHGGKDPGAIGYRHYKEKNIVLGIAKRVRSILKQRGYKVYLTRSKDHFVKLSNRTKYANKKNADIFVSIHANAVPKKYAQKAYGIECYFLAKSKSERAKAVAATENSADISAMNFYGKESFLNTLNSHNIVASNKLAIDLQRGILGSLKKSYSDVHDGGVREGPFWVLVGAQMPSVLVEVGFITHPKEAKRLMSARYQQKLALGLANGIERYFLNNN